jgi:tetratricopeptide (TPR) repeat protein
MARRGLLLGLVIVAAIIATHAFAQDNELRRLAELLKQHTNAGQVTSAIPVARQLYQLIQAQSGEKNHEHVNALLEYADALTDVGLRLLEAGQVDEAEQPLGVSFAIRGGLLPLRDPRMLPGLRGFARWLRFKGRDREATAAEIWDKQITAEEYYRAGRYREALADYLAILEDAQRRLGADDPEIATYHNDVARCYAMLGDDRDAERHYRRAVELEELLGPGQGHEQRLASWLDNLGTTLNALYRFAEAEEVQRRALQLREAQHPINHHELATSLGNLAITLSGEGKYAAAEEYLRRALAAREEHLGLDHVDVATSLSALADILRFLGRHEEAALVLERARTIRVRAFGSKHPLVAVTDFALALARQGQGRFTDAERLFNNAIAAARATLGPDHPTTVMYLNGLGNFYDAQGRDADAAKVYREAYDLGLRTRGAVDLEVLWAFASLAAIDPSVIDPNAYGEWVSRGLSVAERVLNPNKSRPGKRTRQDWPVLCQARRLGGRHELL